MRYLYIFIGCLCMCEWLSNLNSAACSNSWDNGCQSLWLMKCPITKKRWREGGDEGRGRKEDENMNVCETSSSNFLFYNWDYNIITFLPSRSSLQTLQYTIPFSFSNLWSLLLIVIACMHVCIYTYILKL